MNKASMANWRNSLKLFFSQNSQTNGSQQPGQPHNRDSLNSSSSSTSLVSGGHIKFDRRSLRDYDGLPGLDEAGRLGLDQSGARGAGGGHVTVLSMQARKVDSAEELDSVRRRPIDDLKWRPIVAAATEHQTRRQTSAGATFARDDTAAGARLSAPSATDVLRRHSDTSALSSTLLEKVELRKKSAASCGKAQASLSKSSLASGCASNHSSDSLSDDDDDDDDDEEDDDDDEGDAVTLTSSNSIQTLCLDKNDTLPDDCPAGRLAKLFHDDVTSVLELTLSLPDDASKAAFIQEVLRSLKALRTATTLNSHFMVLSSLMSRPQSEPEPEPEKR